MEWRKFAENANRNNYLLYPANVLLLQNQNLLHKKWQLRKKNRHK